MRREISFNSDTIYKCHVLYLY